MIAIQKSTQTPTAVNSDLKSNDDDEQAIESQCYAHRHADAAEW